jgi:hypothetical protein
VLSSEKKRKIFAIDTGSKFKPGTRKYTIIQSSHQMNLKVANKISLKVEKKEGDVSDTSELQKHQTGDTLNGEA